ncbi:MAG TPA: hypothetical protein VIJ57_08545 [Hanamia sp.]
MLQKSVQTYYAAIEYLQRKIDKVSPKVTDEIDKPTDETYYVLCRKLAWLESNFEKELDGFINDTLGLSEEENQEFCY